MVQTTMRDGWPNEWGNIDRQTRVLAEIGSEHFLEVGEHLTIPDGTAVIVSQAERLG
jgi:hypothetical protein